jgi:hypothetical protein
LTTCTHLDGHRKALQHLIAVQAHQMQAHHLAVRTTTMAFREVINK